MKTISRIFILMALFLLGLSAKTLAQAPEGIIYQAEARDDKGKIIADMPLEVQIFILQGSEAGTQVWGGGHNVITNAFGLFVLIIGQGAPISGDVFSDIDWGNYQHFLNVKVKDPKTLAWVDMGTTELLSVPYALYATNALNAAQALYANDAAHAVNADNASFASVAGQVDYNNILNPPVDNDPDPQNEIQDLVLNGHQLSITVNGNPTIIDLSPYLDNTDTQLTEQQVDAMVEDNGFQLNTDPDDFDNTNELQNLSLVGRQLSLTDGNIVTLPANNILEDSDSNTKIQVEKNANDNMIHFDLNGTERWLMNGTRLEPKNTGRSVFIGEWAGLSDDGQIKGNVFLGFGAGQSNTSGQGNNAIGYMSLGENTLGHQNIGIGTMANYYNKEGINNTIIGFEAGRGPGTHNKSGSVFLGFHAGFDETSSNKLYIENSSSSTPLIYGDFETDLARINGNFEVSGAVKIEGGDPGEGKVLTSDVSGNASWAGLPADQVNDADADPANEIQDLQLAGNILTITKNGVATEIDLSLYLDNTDTQLSEAEVDLMVDNNGYQLLTDPDDFDNTNELQNLSLIGRDLSITNGNIVTLPANNLLEDADANTMIQVEKTANENKIRFDLNGTERWVMDGARLESKNSGGSVFIGDFAGTVDDLTENINVFIGYAAGNNNSSGYRNTAVGGNSFLFNIGGRLNTAYGFQSLMNNTGGNENTAIGSGAQYLNSTGNNNTVIGTYANYMNQNGSNNTIIGFKAGYGNYGLSSSGNVFIGYNSGYNETASNKLYIENSNSSTPLIYGDFATNMARINGNFEVSGTLKIEGGDPGDGKLLTSNATGLASWQLPPADQVNDADADPTNEIQDLQMVGNILTITKNGVATEIDLSPYLDNTDTQLTQGEVDGMVQNLGYQLAAADGDIDDTNELQEISLSGNTLSISGGNDIDLSGITAGGNETLGEVLANGNDGGAQQIKNIVDPTDAHDAATKAYVDALESRLADLETRIANLEATGIAPVVETAIVSNIRGITAVCGGNISNDGLDVVTVRGVCWNTAPNPTTGDNITSNGSGIGSFTSTMTGLSPGTTYYVRAYATNSLGTGYGNQETFSTPEITIPQLNTKSISNISLSTAISGGDITNDGKDNISAKGVCWSTNPNPTTNDNITSDGVGLSSYSTVMTGLIGETTYYVRAYATNLAGTGYGNEIIFVTPSSGGGGTSNFKDYRDDHIYNTVIINGQEWMSDNLAYLPVIANYYELNFLSETEPRFYVYGYFGGDVSQAKASGNYVDYGVLYNWVAATSACPEGWHLPSDAEWTALTTWLGGSDLAGGKMKESGLSHWNSPNTGATNESGFYALPGGAVNSYPWLKLGDWGLYWSSTDWSTDRKYARWFKNDNAEALRFYDYSLSGFSVRCVKN